MGNVTELLVAALLGGLVTQAMVVYRLRRGNLRDQAAAAWEAEIAAHGVWRYHEPFIAAAALIDGLLVAEPSLSDEDLCERARTDLDSMTRRGAFACPVGPPVLEFITPDVAQHARRQLVRLAELASIDGLFAEERKDFALMVFATDPVSLHVQTKAFAKAIEKKFMQRPFLAVGYSSRHAARDLMWPADGVFTAELPRPAFTYGDLDAAALRTTSEAWIKRLWQHKGADGRLAGSDSPTTEPNLT